MASNPGDELGAYRELKASYLKIQAENDALKYGGGGGTSGGMESRVAKLEAHMETVRADIGVIKNDVGGIRVSLATVTERVSHLPGKWFVVTSTMAGLALFGGAAVFAERIRHALGL